MPHFSGPQSRRLDNQDHLMQIKEVSEGKDLNCALNNGFSCLEMPVKTKGTVQEGSTRKVYSEIIKRSIQWQFIAEKQTTAKGGRAYNKTSEAKLGGQGSGHKPFLSHRLLWEYDQNWWASPSEHKIFLCTTPRVSQVLMKLIVDPRLKTQSRSLTNAGMHATVLHFCI